MKKSKTIGFRLNSDLYKQIKRLADENSLQVGTFIRLIAVAYVKEHRSS